ncbi:hypothetical protein LTR64_008416 [Lithohypha guttulata]|uniref:uncharacterized protein n=1 Tax=Lithohypha guttulata TaxID=1690604 RepID=UPI002DE01A15|nr:hypothetical protein LTR51_008539 [Lithohypha guttulata]
MSDLPDEIWIQIFDYIDSEQLLRIQSVCRRLRRVARDARLWRAKCFEKAPSAVHAFKANEDSLSELLNSLSLTQAGSTPQPSSSNDVARSAVGMSRRAQAIANWDYTDGRERIDWYSEYMARHAPLHMEWAQSSDTTEIKNVALFDDQQKVIGATEDGNIRIWDIQQTANGRRSFHESFRSHDNLLYAGFEVDSPSSSSTPMQQPTIGNAVDSILVHHSGTKVYVAVEDRLNEIDLNTMAVVSQQKWAWNITAISQQSSDESAVMVGTSYTLNMYDPRTILRNQSQNNDEKVDVDLQERNTVFLPNYAKSWLASQPRSGPRRRQVSMRARVPTSGISRPVYTSRRADPEVYAPVEPGPQTILHRGPNDIVVAGRMPSILFYDKRSFPKLESVIHSGARLSSLTSLEYPPRGATSLTADATLIAAGEYHGRGSLELYELPHTRLTDPQATYDVPPAQDTDSEPALPSTDDAGESSRTTATSEPFSYRNRQSSSSAKLLSVVTQGSRIVYSDTEGGIKWVERDGRGLARRWNINSYEYTHAGGAVVGDYVARKMLTFSSDEQYTSGSLAGMKRGDGDILIWTGTHIGLVTNKVKWTVHDELIAAFEEKMSLDESAQGQSSMRSAEESRRQEEEYARIMRRALERQADERRFLARFGRMSG